MTRLRVGLLFFALIIAGTRHAGAVPPASVTAISVAQHSIVYVTHAAKQTTAFAVLNDQGYTYYMTAAHLLEEADWNNGSRVLTVADPFTGEVRWDAVVVRRPDYVRDSLIFKLSESIPKHGALCIASDLPVSGWPIALAAFSPTAKIVVPPHNDPNAVTSSMRPFPAAVVQRLGNIGSGTNIQPSKFDFSAQIESGFSGAPLVDAQSGLVIGMVSEKPIIRSPDGAIRDEQGKTYVPLIVSRDSRLGVTPGAFRQVFSDSGISPKLVRWDSRSSFPDLAAARRLMTVIAEDTKNNGSASFAAVRSETIRILSAAFAADLTVRAQSVDLSNVTPDFQGMAHAAFGEDCPIGAPPGALVLALRIDARKDNKALLPRLIVTDCEGNEIARTPELRSSIQNEGVVGDIKRGGGDFTTFRNTLTDALRVLSGGDGSRLTRFATDGVLLGDTERSAFFHLRAADDMSGAIVDGAWSRGSLFAASHIPLGATIRSLGPYEGSALARLVQQPDDVARVYRELSQRGTAGWPIKWSTGNAQIQAGTLVAQDRCAYLQLRASDIFSKRYGIVPQ